MVGDCASRSSKTTSRATVSARFMVRVGNSDAFSQASCLRSNWLSHGQRLGAWPDWLPDLHLTHLSVGDATVDLRFWREGDRTRWEITHLKGELNVQQE
jgi:hypothetical protein